MLSFLIPSIYIILSISSYNYIVGTYIKLVKRMFIIKRMKAFHHKNEYRTYVTGDSNEGKG